jgi:hypothetical protein
VRSSLVYINSLLTNPPADMSYTPVANQITLKASKWSGNTLSTPGNFGALDLGGTGASNYSNNITYNYTGSMSVGQTFSTETGDMTGPSQQGISGRATNTSFDSYSSNYYDWYFGRSTYPIDTSLSPITDNGTTYYFHLDPERQDVNDWHVAVVPLITSPSKTGNANITIMGFGVFYIENTNPQGAQSVVTGRFIGMNVRGTASTSGGGGAYTIHLVQ